MTLREMAARIQREGGQVARYMTPPRADGTYATIWGDILSMNQYFELLRLCRTSDQTPEQARVMRAHDAAVKRHS